MVYHIDISLKEFEFYRSVLVIHDCRRAIAILSKTCINFCTGRKRGLSTWHFESRAAQIVTLTPCHLAGAFHILCALVTNTLHMDA